MLRRNCLFVLIVVAMESSSPSLGAYLIVRNGAATIAHALHSVLPAVSQLVVVDTGSTDHTDRLCARYGAELHYFAWTNNFSEARNYALERMRTDWVLALDADEVVDRTSLEAARPLLKDSNTGALRTALHNRLSNGATTSVHYYPRIVRNHPAIRYSGAIHEQIGEAVLRTGLAIADSPVVIFHEGYSQTSPEKIARNAMLLRAELTTHPHDPWLLYHLGLTEFAAQHYAEAQRCLAAALESGILSTAQSDMARLRLAQMALQEEDWKEFEKRISFASSDQQIEGFRLYIDAVHWVARGDRARARQLLTAVAIDNSALVDHEQLRLLRSLCGL